MWGTSRCSTMRPLAASSSRHGRGHLHAAGHGDVVGDRQEQRPGLGVGVAGPQHGRRPRASVAPGGTGRRTSSGTRRLRTPRAPGSARLPAWCAVGTDANPARRSGRRGRPAAVRRRAGRRRAGRAPGLGGAAGGRRGTRPGPATSAGDDACAMTPGRPASGRWTTWSRALRGAARHGRRRAADQPAGDPARRGRVPHRGARRRRCATGGARRARRAAVPRRPLRPRPGRLRRPRPVGPRARHRVGRGQGPRHPAPPTGERT